MIQRKDTLGFVEFLRGKYNLENVKYIYKIFEIMTKKERNFIEKNDFDTIWNSLWMNKNIKQYRNEYDNSKKKFNKLKDGIELDDKSILNLHKLNCETPCFWDTPEWGFPKGRRNLRETDLECAHREFQEETAFKKQDYKFLNIKPIDEVFLGSNNIRYKHVYFIGMSMIDTDEIHINNNNVLQLMEISNLGWFTYEECMHKIRPYNLEKKEALKKANEIITNLINNE